MMHPPNSRPHNVVMSAMLQASGLRSGDEASASFQLTQMLTARVYLTDCLPSCTGIWNDEFPPRAEKGLEKNTDWEFVPGPFRRGLVLWILGILRLCLHCLPQSVLSGQATSAFSDPFRVCVA